MKLFEQYNRVNIAFMIAIFLVSSVASYMTMNLLLIREVDESLEDTQHKLEKYITKHQQMLVEEERDDDLLVSYHVVKNNIKIKVRTVKLFNPDENRNETYRQLTFYATAGNDLLQVQVARPLEGIHQLFKNIITITVFNIFLIIAASVIINRFLLRKLWKPFYKSLDVIRSFRIGAPQSLTFPVTRIEEFASMNDAMKQATDKAGKDYVVLREFTENASHEIQTPLAIIRSKLDLLAQDVSEKQSDILHSAYGAINRLTRLNKSLLLLAKIENRQYSNVQDINLKAKIADKVLQFQELWENNQILFSELLGDSVIQIDPELCEILLNNLLSNATHHNFSGGCISVILRPGRLCIKNTGKSGELNAALMFSRFYKGTSDNSNNGLGLSIVRQICEMSGIMIGYGFESNMHVFTLSWKEHILNT
jgi:signal transduction histidine kinase